MITAERAREQLQEWSLSDDLIQKICNFLQDNRIGQLLWEHLAFFHTDEACQLFTKQFSSPNSISPADFFQAAANYLVVDYVANELHEYNKQAKEKLIADGQSPFSQFIFQLIHAAPDCTIIPALQVTAVEHENPFFLGEILTQLRAVGVERATLLASLVNAHSFPEMFICLIKTYFSRLDANVLFTHMEKRALIKIISVFKSQYDLNPDSKKGILDENFETMLEKLVGNNRQLLILFLQNFLLICEQDDRVVWSEGFSLALVQKRINQLLILLKKAADHPNPEVVVYLWMKLYSGFVRHNSVGLDQAFDSFVSANSKLFSLPLALISESHCEIAFALTQLDYWLVQEDGYGMEEEHAALKKAVSSLIEEHKEYATLITGLATQFHEVLRNEISAEYVGKIDRNVSIFSHLASQFLQTLQALDRKINVNFISNDKDVLNQSEQNFEWLSLLFKGLTICYINKSDEDTEENLVSILNPHLGKILKSILLNPGLGDVLTASNGIKNFFTVMLEESSQNKAILAKYRYVLDIYSDSPWLFNAFLMIYTPDDVLNYLYPGVMDNIEDLAAIVFSAEQRIKLQAYPLIFNFLGELSAKVGGGLGGSLCEYMHALC